MFMKPRLNLKFDINAGESQHKIDQNSTVVAAIHHFYDYSIHVKFDRMLDEKTIENIESSAGSGDGELEMFTDS